MIQQSRIEDNTYKGTFLLILFIILLAESCLSDKYSKAERTEQLWNKKEVKFSVGLSTQISDTLTPSLRR